MLAEIDTLDIHVIVNDELDPISPSPNPAVKVASRFMGIPLSPLSSERGGATMEMRMDNICCAAHGISLLLVGCPISSFVHDIPSLVLSRLKIHRSRPRAIRSTNFYLTQDPKARSGRETPAVSEQRSARSNILPYHITTEITLVSSSCHRRLTNSSGSYFTDSKTGGLTKAIELIKKRNDGHKQIVMDVHPNRPAFRGVQADRPISLEADPSFEELGAAGAKLLKSDQPHTVLDDFFLVSGEIPRKTTYEDGIHGGMRFNPSTGFWEQDTLIMEERYVMCNLKGTVLLSQNLGSIC